LKYGMVIFGEDARAGQSAKQTIKRLCVYLGELCDRIDRPLVGTDMLHGVSKGLLRWLCRIPDQQSAPSGNTPV